jgi:IS30 family transposase
MKQLNLTSRSQIEKGLTIKLTFSEIGRSIGMNRTTVSREVRAYAIVIGNPARSKCVHQADCIFEDKSRCPVPICQKRVCSKACSQCASYCDRYAPILCPKLLRPPYVCNGCEERSICSLEKHYYQAEHAHAEYKKTLSESRSGISLSEEDLQVIANTVIPLIRNGISLPVAYDAYADQMPVSLRTLYKYVARGIFDIGPMDLRRTVQRRPNRKKSGPQLHVDKQCHINRTFADFLFYLEQHPELNVIEMDTVEGSKGGKVILTLFFRDCDLQIMILRENKTSAAVTQAYQMLRKQLGEDFQRVFSLVLTDRGTEFSNPTAIEFNARTGKVDVRVFYCDPQQTNQKSRCERNHEYLRYIIPKGTSLNDCTPEEITLVMNHVNSMPRPRLNGKTPYAKFVEIYGVEAAKKLGLELIPLEQLNLKPELLKK